MRSSTGGCVDIIAASRGSFIAFAKNMWLASSALGALTTGGLSLSTDVRTGTLIAGPEVLYVARPSGAL